MASVICVRAMRAKKIDRRAKDMKRQDIAPGKVGEEGGEMGDYRNKEGKATPGHTLFPPLLIWTIRKGLKAQG